MKSALRALAVKPRIFVLTAAFGASGRACDSGGWDVTPSEAYTWGYQPPQGCTCQETGVSLADCEIFDCKCVCDLTADQCDLNCCCDVECTEIELNRFAKLNACLSEGPADEVSTMCYSTDSLDAINPRYSLTGGGTSQSAVDGLLCVQYDNSGSKGEFFEDPGTLSASIFSDSAGRSEFTYQDSLATSRGAGKTEGDDFFDKGDRIPVAFSRDGGDTLAAFGGFLSLPVADDTGQCNEANSVKFGVPVPGFDDRENTCTREVKALEKECSSVFGWGRFSSDLFVGASGTATPGGAWRVDNYVQVEISSITWRDWNTGKESDFTGVNCGSFYYNGTVAATANSTCMGGENGDTAAASMINATEGCKNALLSICYTIFHDGEGSITSVKAAVIVTDIPPGLGGSSSFAASPQSFSVEFRVEGTSDAVSVNTRSQERGNLVERSRSGNPGYLDGFPVLAGRVEWSGDYQYIAAGGSDDNGRLELITDIGRGCGDVSASPAEFGYDGVSCCVVALTRDELNELCEGIGDYVDPETGFTPIAFQNTSFTEAHIGAYGNADPLDVSQWVELSFASSSDTAAWDEDRGVCSSMVSTLEYRILYAAVGSRSNPQNKIVSAEARYGKTDWVWQEESKSEQNFMVCNSVSFKIYDQEGRIYTSPSPPVAFTVPWDVFYPFFISTSGSSATSPQPLGQSNAAWALVLVFYVALLPVTFST